MAKTLTPDNVRAAQGQPGWIVASRGTYEVWTVPYWEIRAINENAGATQVSVKGFYVETTAPVKEVMDAVAVARKTDVQYRWALDKSMKSDTPPAI